MRIVAWMISRMIVVRFLAILLGLSLFVLTLEIVANATEILAIDNGGFVNIFSYILMRSPATLSTFLPMSLLLALLLTLTELSYRNEMTAIWAAGISPLKLTVMLMPVALLAGTIHFLLVDRGMPAAAPILRDWGVADYGEKKLRIGERDPIWLRSGNDILRAASANKDSTVLEDVVIFRRNDDGLLTEQTFANLAQLKAGQWELTGVTTYFRGNKQPERTPTAAYPGIMRPAAAGSRSGDPEEMTFGQLGYFIANDGFGIRPAYVYQTSRHKRLTLFCVSIVMIALCVPLAARFRRGGGLGLLFGAGVGMGFGFFVLDGITGSIGELGIVSPWLAAWSPILIFAMLAIYLTMDTERV